jgi:hypothetical protein
MEKFREMAPNEMRTFLENTDTMSSVVTDVGFKNGADFALTVANAFRFGLACGIELQVVGGKLERRKTDAQTIAETVEPGSGAHPPEGDSQAA